MVLKVCISICDIFYDRLTGESSSSNRFTDLSMLRNSFGFVDDSKDQKSEESLDTTSTESSGAKEDRRLHEMNEVYYQLSRYEIVYIDESFEQKASMYRIARHKAFLDWAHSR